MKVLVHYRKGGQNKEFRKIVETVAACMRTLGSTGRVKERLLPKLKAVPGPMSGAWQDADDLKNILGDNAYRFDIYNWNDKVAMEIEESEVKYVWKDLVKLSIGARRRRVTYGLLICPAAYSAKKLKRPVKIYNDAIRISNFMADLIWVKNLAIIGYG